MPPTPPAESAGSATADATLVPVSLPDDTAEVKFALSTAIVLWSYGAPTDALEWVRRAVRHAADAGADERAMDLAKAASAIAGHAARLSAPPPPDRADDSGRHTADAIAVPPPPALPSVIVDDSEPDGSTAPPVPLVTKPSVPAKPDLPPPPVALAPVDPTPSAAPLPLVVPSAAAAALPLVAAPAVVVPPPPSVPAPSLASKLPAPPRPASSSSTSHLRSPSLVAPPVSTRPGALPSKLPARNIPGASVPPPPRPAVSLPAPPMPRSAHLPVKSVAPPAATAVTDATTAASSTGVSQAVRAFVVREATGRVAIRLAEEGEAASAGQLEVMVVALSPHADLGAVFDTAGALQRANARAQSR